MKACFGIAILIVVLVPSAGTAFAAIGSSSLVIAPDPGVVGVTAGTGSLLMYGTHIAFIPRGFNSVGLLYPAQYARTMCSDMGEATQRALARAEAAMTTETDRQLLAMNEHWRANTVRFQVSQGALTYENESGLSAYTNMVLSVIRQARAMGMITIVSMQTEAYSCTSHRSNGKLRKLPDKQTEEAWAQIAPKLSGDRGIILEAFNEPNTEDECGLLNWTYWTNGCGAGNDVGMKVLGNYLRTLAPDNVILFDSDHNGGRFTGFTPPSGMPANSAYAVHPYYYTDGVSGWDTRFGKLQSSGRTVVATEWNESSTCKTSPNQLLASQLVNIYLPAHEIGLIVHSWDAPGGVLVNRFDDPVDSSLKCTASTGATLAYNRFWSEAGGGQPAPEVHVSSVNMADGRVNTVTVALANNGGKEGSPGPQIAHSVDLLVVQSGHIPKPQMLVRMQLSTTSPWTNGSFTLAAASGLAQMRLTAKTGDSLIISVHYNEGGSRVLTYLLR